VSLRRQDAGVPLEFQTRVLELVRDVHGGRALPSPTWLNRPGQPECKRRWPLVQRLYSELTEGELPPEMPSRERRTVDLVLQRRGEAPRIIEVDEVQHFNGYRAATIRTYPRSVRVAFDRRSWLRACDAKQKLEGGGFARPCSPLFPAVGGRHQQRAFRDALTDVLPALHGYQPTLRIADFEAKDWIFSRGARAKLAELLAERV
jgi:hypothetical protein